MTGGVMVIYGINKIQRPLAGQTVAQARAECEFVSRTGSVTVNGAPANFNYVLQEGDRLEFEFIQRGEQ